MRISRALVLAVCLALGGAAWADVLVTKAGRRYEGKVVSETSAVVRFQTSAGVFEIARGEIATLERGKTPREELAEREKRAVTADDLHALGVWAEEQRLRADAKRLMKRALELDPAHPGANRWFGKVYYKGRWLTPEERDAAAAIDLAAEMRAKGLVPWKERWVTPEDLAHLERGEELVDGIWIPFEEAQRRRGLELHDGAWLPRAEALARNDVASAAARADVRFNVLVAPDAILAGPQDEAGLAQVAAGLARGRTWFDLAFQSEPGIALFGGRLAEFYMFEADAAYLGTIAHFAALTPTVGEGWAGSVAGTHGFLWWDPYPLSSARRWKRDQKDLAGHCHHHWGHLLLNRLGYDGRLLPPWYDEGVAALTEFRAHARNDVFCRGARKPGLRLGPSTGGHLPRPKPGTEVESGPGRTAAPFDPAAMRDGRWREALAAGLAEAPPFDLLATLQFDELETADIAAAMGIVAWLESRGPGALRRFHDELRRRAPPQPERVIVASWEREACYEAAFKAAAGVGWKEADRAWRTWTASR
jgi:hypothetical protein